MIQHLTNLPLFGTLTTPCNTIGQVTSVTSFIASIVFGYLRADRKKPETIICTLGFLTLSSIAFISASSLKLTATELKKSKQDNKRYQHIYEKLKKQLEETEHKLKQDSNELKQSQKDELHSIDELSKAFENLIKKNIVQTKLKKELSTLLEKLKSLSANQAGLSEQAKDLNQVADNLQKANESTEDTLNEIDKASQESQKVKKAADEVLIRIHGYARELDYISEELHKASQKISDEALKQELKNINIKIFNFKKHFIINTEGAT